jgi:prepilin-type processing-associated H-X9-DG protein
MENELDPARTPPVVSSTPPQPEPAKPAEQVAPHTHRRELGPAFYLKLAALLFFIGYAVAFVVGNNKTITVDFVFADGHVSLIWTIMLLLLVGLIAGALVAHLYRRHGRKQVRQP